MAKVLYSVSMSLDGFIAGPGGDMSWLTGYLGPNPEIDAFVGRVGAILVGAARTAATTRTAAPRRRARRSAAGGTDRSSCSPAARRPSRCRA
jgi:riboflavin biosynthesis pyrimidine reductase